MHQPGEPSVELLLDRIKRVIARENERIGEERGSAATISRSRGFTRKAGSAPAFDSEPAPDPVDTEEAAEVLDLDEDEIVAQAPYGPADDYPAAIPLEAAQDDDDLIDYGWAEPKGLGEVQAPYSEDEPEPEHGPLGHTEPLTSDEASAATRETLAGLTVLSALARGQEGGALSERSLEELTRELLRPMLAEWLDTNLPPLVERLVQAEIKRIVGIGR